MLELISPALADPRRTSLENLLEATRPGPNPLDCLPDARHVLFFATLPLELILREHPYSCLELLHLDACSLTGREDPAATHGWDLDDTCYAAIAWKIEQLFQAAEKTEDEVRRYALNDAGEYHLSRMLTCFSSLNEQLVGSVLDILDENPDIIDTIGLDEIHLSDFRSLSSYWFNERTLRLRGTEEETEAFFQVFTMNPMDLYTIVYNAIGFGCNADETLKRYDLVDFQFVHDAMKVERLCPGFTDDCIVQHLESSYIRFTGAELVRALRPVFIKPFAALWESGALLAVHKTAQECTRRPSSKLEQLMQGAREQMDNQ